MACVCVDAPVPVCARGAARAASVSDLEVKPASRDDDAGDAAPPAVLAAPHGACCGAHAHACCTADACGAAHPAPPPATSAALCAPKTGAAVKAGDVTPREEDVFRALMAMYAEGDGGDARTGDALVRLPPFAAAAALRSLRLCHGPRERPNFNSEPCVVCLEPIDKTLDGVFVCPNSGRPCCSDCMAQYIDAQALVRDVFPLRCPDGCSHTLKAQAVRKLLQPHTEVLFKYERVVDLHTHPDRRECPSCENRQDGDPAKPVMNCNSCGQEYCYHHGLAHVGHSCKAVKRQPVYHRVRNSLWKMVHTKRCPKCKGPIQKNGGCPHMSCRKCKHEFCWYCRRDWKVRLKSGVTVYHVADPLEGLRPSMWGRRCRSVQSLTLSTLIVALTPAAVAGAVALGIPYWATSALLDKRRKRRQRRRRRAANMRAATHLRTQLERERRLTENRVARRRDSAGSMIQRAVAPARAIDAAPRATVPTGANAAAADAVAEAIPGPCAVKVMRPELCGVYCILLDGTGRRRSLTVAVSQEMDLSSRVVRHLNSTQRVYASTAVETSEGVTRLHAHGVGWITLDSRLERVGPAPWAEYEDRAWWHGDMSRSDAFKALRAEEDEGAFLLRRKIDQRALDNHIGVVHLGIRVGKTVRNLQVEMRPNGTARLTSARRVYATLDVLVAEGLQGHFPRLPGLTHPARKPFALRPPMWF